MVKELYEFAWHDISDVQIVAEYPEVSSTELYVSASLWMVDTFKSSDSVLELEDKDAGILKGKFTLTAPQFLGTIYFDNIVTIEVKDGKARLTISAPISQYTITQTMAKKPMCNSRNQHWMFSMKIERYNNLKLWPVNVTRRERLVNFT